jgi:hypothetical protein
MKKTMNEFDGIKFRIYNFLPLYVDSEMLSPVINNIKRPMIHSIATDDPNDFHFFEVNVTFNDEVI